jgi:hypothetical protein
MEIVMRILRRFAAIVNGLCVLAVLFCASQYLLGYTTTLAWFYVVSLIQGVTAGFINMYVIQNVY